MPRPSDLGRPLLLCSLFGAAGWLRADLASRSPFLDARPAAAPAPREAPPPRPAPPPLTEAERRRRDDRMLVTDLLQIAQQQRQTKPSPAPAASK
ncbi:MAG TPA: hypothetical protein VHC86_05120 [Opitutaceae bacterium]|nr:hypothetical protein [Opitutaceae bacterium]